VAATTASTSTTTGAIVVSGGGGFAGNIYGGGGLHISGGMTSQTANAVLLNTAASTNNKYIRFDNTGGIFYLGLESSAGGTIFGSATPYSLVLGTANSTALHVATDGTIRQTISSAGVVTITSSTASTSTTSGALVVSGGAGVNGALFVGLGATITGASLTVSRAGEAADVFVILNGNTSRSKNIQFQTAGLRRWNLGCNSTAESGSDAGSNLVLSCYTDADVAIDSPITIVRAAGGAITITRPLVTAASTTTSAGIRSPHGTAPSAPVDGDFWTTTAGAFIRINGVTKTFTLV
jgi:hypothetical protein